MGAIYTQPAEPPNILVCVPENYLKIPAAKSSSSSCSSSSSKICKKTEDEEEDENEEDCLAALMSYVPKSFNEPRIFSENCPTI
jgi:hypothetical protein